MDTTEKYKIGFTGTRKTLPETQTEKLKWLLQCFIPDITRVNHGIAEGADSYFDLVCQTLGIKRYWYPSIFVAGHVNLGIPPKNVTVAQEKKDPLVRNHDIVNASDFLIACPFERQEQLHSGTWATIRYARKQKKKIIIIYSDGEISVEN